ncbi:hypothetical protein [Cyclobacterium xiamenense]|uniref:hypothetical protein n=1 Tax=Cyclobacterium xiamenense TaxID=1297121 RepID=UPI0035D06276
MRQYSNRNVREGAPYAVGLRSFLLIATGCGLLASCQNQDPIPMTVPDATAYQAPSNQKIRYLALGDSYTIGEGEKESIPIQSKSRGYWVQKDGALLHRR